MSRIITSFFILIIISPLIGWLLGINMELAENRILSQKPAISFMSVLNNDFYAQYEEYFNEHFIYRAWLIKAKNWTDYQIFNTSPSPKVYVGTNGWLYYHDDFRDDCNIEEKMDELAQQLHNLETVIEASGRKFMFIVAPNKSTIYPEYTGFTSLKKCSKSGYEYLLDAFKKYPVNNFIRFEDLLTASKKEHQLYFKLDTHWNLYGAEIVCKAILKHLSADSWSELYPKIESSSVNRSGDLADIMGLSSFLHETADTPDKIHYLSEIKVDNLKPLENGRPHFRVIAKPPSDKYLLPRVLFIRDSFMTLPLELLQGSFEQLYAIWTPNLLTQEVLDEIRGSDIVILEIVERDLPAINIDVRKVETSLTDKIYDSKN